jgi:hypothetical protein
MAGGDADPDVVLSSGSSAVLAEVIGSTMSLDMDLFAPIAADEGLMRRTLAEGKVLAG